MPILNMVGGGGGSAPEVKTAETRPSANSYGIAFLLEDDTPLICGDFFYNINGTQNTWLGSSLIVAGHIDIENNKAVLYGASSNGGYLYVGTVTQNGNRLTIAISQGYGYYFNKSKDYTLYYIQE